MSCQESQWSEFRLLYDRPFGGSCRPSKRQWQRPPIGTQILDGSGPRSSFPSMRVPQNACFPRWHHLWDLLISGGQRSLIMQLGHRMSSPTVGWNNLAVQNLPTLASQAPQEWGGLVPFGGHAFALNHCRLVNFLNAPQLHSSMHISSCSTALQ